MKKLLKFAEKAFTILSLLLFSGDFIFLILSGGVSQGDGREAPSAYPLIQLVFLIIYVVTFSLLAKQWKEVLNLLLKEKFILLLLGIAFISVLWSYDPSLTLRRSIALGGTSLFGIYFGIRYTLKQQLQLLGWMFSIAILLSFLFVLILPEYGIMGGSVHGGLWRGIFAHKNFLGKAMVLSAIVFLLLAVNNQKNQFLLWCGFSFSLVLLIFSTSKTALISCALLLFAACLYRALQKRYDTMIPALIAVVMVSGSLVLQVTANIYPPLVVSEASSTIIKFQPSSSAVKEQTSSKTSAPSAAKEQTRAKTASSVSLRTLTGRTALWPLLWQGIEKHPWLGYGYSGFWENSDEAVEIQKRVGNWATNSHNGFLELWLDLGILGVLIFLTGFLITMLRAIALISNERTLESLWPLLYMTFIVLFNLTTSTLVNRNSVFWVLYAAVVFSVLIQSQLVSKKVNNI